MKKLIRKFNSLSESEKDIFIGICILCVIFIAIVVIVVVNIVSDKNKDDSSDNSSSQISSETTTPTDDSSDNTTTSGDNSDSSTTTTEGSKTEPEGVYVVYKLSNSWENNGKMCYQIDISVKNNSKKDLSNWNLSLDVDAGTTIDGWNAKYAVAGTKLTATPEQYNSEIKAGGSVSIGFIMTTSGKFKPETFRVNGESVTSQSGNVSGNNNQNNQNNGSNNQGGTTADVTELLKRSDKAVNGDDWLSVSGNKIVDKDGKQVWLTGVNWFGYNTGTNIFDGLWNSELVSTVETIADHGFNLIRIPFSAELINQWAAGEYPKANYNQAYNPNLNQMNSLQIFDYVVNLCEKNGIKIMIDIHCAETNASGHTVNLWYTDKVSVDKYYSALEWMANRYKNNDTIIAYDLKNEPHGKPYEKSSAAIWNDSTAANNWKYVAETAANKVLAKNPNVLIMVEGIEIYPKNISTNSNFSSTDDDDYYFNWWGGNLRGVADYPINLGKYQNKLVYSPHDYGPTVYEQPWFKSSYNYDTLMRDCWHDNWFYIYEDKTAPLLIGEWGGFMKEPNITWMTHMRTLIKKYNLNHTFWCFNANSGDTGGLVLDDFKTWDTEKYAFVKEVLWQENGKFVGLDHAIPLGDNGITLSKAKGL